MGIWFSSRFLYSITAHAKLLYLKILHKSFAIQKWLIFTYRDIFLKPGIHAVCYIGTMPRLAQIETCFFGIIQCNSHFIIPFYNHVLCRQILVGNYKTGRTLENTHFCDFPLIKDGPKWAFFHKL